MEGKIQCGPRQLQLHVTFNCGQCYRWNVQPDGSWIGVFSHCIWTIKHENGYLRYKVVADCVDRLKEWDQNKEVLEKYLEAAAEQDNVGDDIVNSVLWDYFRMFEDVANHYERWSHCDANFKEKAEKFYGLRMLKQDSEEILFTFICSSNTTISRITSMVEQLCLLYGKKIGEVNGIPYYDFPDVSKLAEPSVLKALQKAKFGYRAQYIVKSAQEIMKMGGKNWFKKLNSLCYTDAKLEMTKLPGIGEKVADCVCLMGLDHLNAIPVDTHVFQISQQYIPDLQGIKTVNKGIYKRIGDFFRNLFGRHAGWAHVVLFCADLRMHKPKIKASKIKKPEKKLTSKTVISKYFSSTLNNRNNVYIEHV